MNPIAATRASVFAIALLAVPFAPMPASAQAAPPTVTLTANPPTVDSGETTTLTWTSSNATDCTAGKAWSGPRATSGSAVVTPTAASNVYVLTCTGSGGSAKKSAKITVDPPYGLSTRPTLAPLSFPTSAAQPGDVSVTKAFPNLVISGLLFVTAAPGDSQHLFAVSQSGVIYIFDNNPNATVLKVFLDINARVTDAGGEMGLLGLAFDPDYQTNGFFYVNNNPNFTGTQPDPCGEANPPTACRTNISRFQVTANPEVANPASETQLLTYQQPYMNHKGGWLGFGFDGKLYISAGDGGSAGDPRGNGQNLGVPLGKMLRINSDGSIPSDNPFVGVAGARPEIWSYGMRNPFRASFDRATGQLWVGDVGQNAYEEVDLITRGGNYGWNTREGLHGYPNAGTPKPVGNNFIDPVVEYSHSQGCSITGGYVYRGGAIPALSGTYLYTDYCSPSLWSATTNPDGTVTSTMIGNGPGSASSFGEDLAGELYITSLFEGSIYKIRPGTGGGGGTFPQQLSATGLFTNTANLTPNPGLIPYDLNAAFYSDGVRKRRWFAIPNGTQITFSATGAWTFPPGSVTVKEFEVTRPDGSTRRLELRVFVNQASGWQGYTYKWNAAGTDATLLTDGQTETITVLTPDGGTQTQNYEYPSRAACATCHSAAAGKVLGLRTSQLNRVFAYPAATDNELRSLNHIGLFTSNIGSAAQYPALTDPLNKQASLASRARAYLEVNCSQCHRPGGPTPVNMDMRSTTPLANSNLIDVPPTAGTLGLPNARRIAPGVKSSSVVWERMRLLDENRMPNLASHVVDADGVKLIGRWINAGAPEQ